MSLFGHDVIITQLCKCFFLPFSLSIKDNEFFLSRFTHIKEALNTIFTYPFLLRSSSIFYVFPPPPPPRFLLISLFLLIYIRVGAGPM